MEPVIKRKFKWEHKEHIYNKYQYNLLVDVSEKKDPEIWNGWRKSNPESKIELSGANLQNMYLSGVDFSNADMREVNLHKSDISNCLFNGADISFSYISSSDLSGTTFEDVNISGVRARGCIVDGRTLFFKCVTDNNTDFTGVGFASARVDPALEQIFMYNVRRLGWEEWYYSGSLVSIITKLTFIMPFWWVSDYGISTSRILKMFLLLALIFAFLYYVAGLHSYPGVIDNLFEIDGETISSEIIPLRSLYFSVVTMTTLGFGDMYANANSVLGHVLLTIQVLIGYFLLGALITRLAILFTAGGPSWK